MATFIKPMKLQSRFDGLTNPLQLIFSIHPISKIRYMAWLDHPPIDCSGLSTLSLSSDPIPRKEYIPASTVTFPYFLYHQNGTPSRGTVTITQDGKIMFSPSQGTFSGEIKIIGGAISY